MVVRLDSLADKITRPISMSVFCNIDGVALLMCPSLKRADAVAYGFKGCIDGLSENI